MNVHVVPDNDLIDHETVGDQCVCRPRVEYIDPDTGVAHDAPMITHHSLDGRELTESIDGSESRGRAE